jgi:hypothetical protein
VEEPLAQPPLSELAAAQAELALINAQRDILVSRIARLTASERGTPDLSPDDKIRLFASLFRGREDVYARRFESSTSGRSGYAPACGNEWVAGICEKPKVRCEDCAHRAFIPVTDIVFRKHLQGHDPHDRRDFTMGLYPLMQDDHCQLLAIDFDKSSWADDARAVRDTCKRLAIDSLLERSRSGNGAHIWIFFAHAVPAAQARALGTRLITETMAHRPELGFDSYDRLFPSQDTLPRGGFGNVIALPLQKKPCAQGNSATEVAPTASGNVCEALSRARTSGYQVHL